MTLLHPSYLWALSGLLIPLAIHLWSKHEGRIIKVGSIKHLEGTAAAQRNSLHFNELWLLLLRMAAITLLVVILAQPHMMRRADTIAIMYIVEPSLLDNGQIMNSLDSLEGSQIRLLQAGFPLYGQGTLSRYARRQAGKQTKQVSYWHLAQQMQDLPTDSIVVFTKGFAAKLKGMRPTISKRIKWIVLEDERTPKTPIEAQKSGDSLKIMSVQGDFKKLVFTSETLSQNANTTINEVGDSISIRQNGKFKMLALDSMPPLKVNLVYDSSFNSDRKYLEASFRALSKYLNRPIALKSTQKDDQIVSESSDLLIWLKKDSVPDHQVKTLFFDAEALSPEGRIIVPTARADRFALTQHLNAENVIAQHLPENLLTLFDLHPNLEEKIKPYDNRQVDEKELQTHYKAGKNITNRASIVDLTIWLWPLFLLFLIAERLLSRYRKQ